ncbi:MAG: GNAT family N-acetyltransferase [Bdellovibrionaceae bacterium]|nr:GNAT family N-acetyltransferase [Pseudobdellovibrionaceae bacterium]
MTVVVGETERIRLRTWSEADLLPYADLNADPEVMEFFPSTMRFDDSLASYRRIQDGFRRHGFGLWAAESKATDEFMGFIGLSIPNFEAAFMPCVEIGWRLAKNYWGQGLATEGARKALELGFDRYQLAEIVSFTAKTNVRSWNVMRKIGMTAAGEFDHPKVDPASPLCRHVLYKMTQKERPSLSR